MRARLVAVFVLAAALFSSPRAGAQQIAPGPPSGVPDSLTTNPSPPNFDGVEMTESFRQYLDLTTSPDADPQWVKVAREMYPAIFRLIRIHDERAGTPLIHVSSDVRINGEWSVSAGLNMGGWLDPGILSKVSDAVSKFQLLEPIHFVGYTPVVGVKYNIGRRFRVSLLYGTRPPQNGVRLYSLDPTKQQVRVSAAVIF